MSNHSDGAVPHPPFFARLVSLSAKPTTDVFLQERRKKKKGRFLKKLDRQEIIPILNHDDIETPRKERRRCTVAAHRGTHDEGNEDSVELELE